MSTYLVRTFNHFHTIQNWCRANNATAQLDVLTFDLEIKARNRFYKLLPQFWQRIDGRTEHFGQITPYTEGFIGWRPYPVIQFTQLQDKRVFNAVIQANQLTTPRTWQSQSASDADTDFILKSARGSFGLGLLGPYRAGHVCEPSTQDQFAQQFIEGDILKVWYWGGVAFHAHLHERPTIMGDGTNTIETLVNHKLQRINQTWQTYGEQDYVTQSLAYQNLTLQTVLALHQTAWLDYRYGRRFVPSDSQLETDNALPRLAPDVVNQIAQAGHVLKAEVDKEYNLPVAFAVDGVLDKHGRVWWLEINSNPMLPPTGYAPMLQTLFGNNPAA